MIIKMIKNTSIKIGVKIKPSPPGAKETIAKSLVQEGGPPTVLIKIGGDNKKFEVDVIHDANVSKTPMFQDLHIDRLVEKFVAGFNVTVMAYGQTGAGKTYCMEGNQDENGIIMDTIRQVYERI